MDGDVHTLDVRWETSSGQEEMPERQALEARFVDGLEAGLRTALSALEPVVLHLLELGVRRKELTQLTVTKGFKPSHVRTLLSQILVRVGSRSRKPGAGPKTPALGLVILAFACEKARAQAYKMLLAAAHAARKEAQVQLGSAPPHLKAGEPPIAQTPRRYLVQNEPPSSLLTENSVNRHFRL